MQDNYILYAIPVTQKKIGQTPVYRHPDAKYQLSTAPKNIKSLAQLWDISVNKFSTYKLIEQMTFQQINSDILSIGSWFLDNKIEKVYMYSKNCPQWTLTDITTWNYAIITIPLYDTLGNDAFDHIISSTEGTTVLASQSQGAKLIDHLKRQKGKIDKIIFTDKIPVDKQEQFNDLGLKLLLFDDIKKHNKIIQKPLTSWESHLTYIYTSGTTGIPKGVIYTHEMVLTQLFALQKQFQMKQNDIHMSFLPIAHAYQRFMIWDCIYSGANIRYAKHLVTQILKDFAIIKPTVIPLVPRLLNKLYAPMKQLSQTQNGKAKIKHLFGGNVRLLATGSAPVSAEVLAFFKQMLECDIRQGYGQTQSCTVTFITYQNQTNFGHVGGPNKSVQYKLVDVPEMNYTSQTNPPKGQVCFRGKSIFNAYYNNPQATKETIDSEGWIHTGDIGIILPGGALQIVDRKKNIFKLSQGQYVAPEKIENIYMRCKYIASCFVYGQSLQSYLLGFVNPTPQLLPAIAKELNIDDTNIAQL